MKLRKFIYYLLLVLGLGGGIILALHSLAGIYETTPLKVVGGVAFLVAAVPLGLDAIFVGKIFNKDD